DELGQDDVPLQRTQDGADDLLGLDRFDCHGDLLWSWWLTAAARGRDLAGCHGSGIASANLAGSTFSSASSVGSPPPVRWPPPPVARGFCDGGAPEPPPAVGNASRSSSASASSSSRVAPLSRLAWAGVSPFAATTSARRARWSLSASFCSRSASWPASFSLSDLPAFWASLILERAASRSLSAVASFAAVALVASLAVSTSLRRFWVRSHAFWGSNSSSDPHGGLVVMGCPPGASCSPS